MHVWMLKGAIKKDEEKKLRTNSKLVLNLKDYKHNFTKKLMSSTLLLSK